MANEVYLTEEGYQKLKDELNHLQSVTRHEIAEKLEAARQFGDLSENAEYDAAREEQTQVETKILQLENQLKNAVILDENEAKSKEVTPFSIVVVEYVEDGEKEEYKIVGITEADITKNWISNVSPIGAALLGKKKGDIIDVKTPGGKIKIKVVEIKK